MVLNQNKWMEKTNKQFGGMIQIHAYKQVIRNTGYTEIHMEIQILAKVLWKQ